MALPPVFLSCAVTGGMSVPAQSAAIPATPQEIVDSAVDANAAGAAIVHIHVRDRQTGKPVADLGLFREVLAGIGERCDAIVQPTSGGGVGMTIEERARVVTECQPEMATLKLRELQLRDLRRAPSPRDAAPSETEYLDCTCHDASRNTFQDLYRVVGALPGGGHQARVRGLRRGPPPQPAPPG